jgi:hypothetical protein
MFSGHLMPAAYPGSSYKTLSNSGSNSTHWWLSTLCAGCSQWTDNASKSVSLNPASTAVIVAWGSSTRAVTTPANNASAFPAHDAKNKVSFDLSSAKIANFTGLVATLA